MASNDILDELGYVLSRGKNKYSCARGGKNTIDFQILNFTRPEGGIRVSRTLSTSSRIPTDNAVKLNI